MATQQQVADHLFFREPKSVRVLISKGVLPAAATRAGLDLDICREAYIRYLRSVNSGQTEPIVNDEDKENFTLLLEKEKWREKKRQNDEAENLIAPISLLVEALEKTGVEIIQILDMIIPNMKRRCPEFSAIQAEILNKELIKCRNLISKIEINLQNEP